MDINIKDIPPPLSLQTLAHGRHVLTIGGIIVVLAWVPAWNLTTLNPLGFKLDAMAALTIWCLLSGALVYFAVRLFTGVQAQLPAWLKHFAVLIKKFEDGDRTPVAETVGFMARRAVWIGYRLPLFVAGISLLVALAEIHALAVGTP